MMGRRADIDLTGLQVNELTVIGPSDVRKNRYPTWECICTCGVTCYFTTTELKSGRAKSCGHLRGQVKTLDLTDKTFGDLTVLFKIENKGNSKSPSGNIVGRTFWHCICICGEECDVQTSDLTSGKRKDCGHSHRAYLHQKRTKDVTGEIFGYLKVLEMLPSIKEKNKWRAMCRAECLLCGNVIDVQKDYLVSGDTKSCGCLKSAGEQAILEYLIEHNIPHKTQYHFEDLKTPNNGYCWFDFGVLKEDEELDFLIEFQGKQHYEEQPGPWNFGGYARTVTDPLKKEYCANHDIALYEIKYDSDIKSELDKIFASQSCAKPA